KSVVLSRRSSIPRRSNRFGCLLLATTAWRRTSRRGAGTALTRMHLRRQSGAPRKVNAAWRSVVCVASISPPAPQRTALAAALAHECEYVEYRRDVARWLGGQRGYCLGDETWLRPGMLSTPGWGVRNGTR